MSEVTVVILVTWIRELVTAVKVVTVMTKKTLSHFLLLYFFVFFFVQFWLKSFDNSNCDKTQQLNFRQNSKTSIVTKLKKLDKTQKLRLSQNWKLKRWQNSKTQIVTKLIYSNCDKTQKLKFWQNPKTQIVTKVKNSNFDKTQNL